jgi:hypothetical protein
MKLFKKLPNIRFAVLLPALFILTFAAFAVQTALPIITPLGPYISGQPTANSLNFAFTACDASNGNSFAITGTEILLVENTDTMAAHTFTVSSVADQQGRTQDITAYSVPESDFAAFSFRQGVTGWRQVSDSTVHMTCSANTITFAVVRPNN